MVLFPSVKNASPGFEVPDLVSRGQVLEHD